MQKPFLIFLFSLVSFFLAGQSVLDRKIDLHLEDVPVPEALLLLAAKAEIDIAFSDQYFEHLPAISFNFQNKSARYILKQLLPSGQTKYTLNGNQLILSPKRKNIVKKYSISGYIEDADTGEKLVGATVFSTVHQKGCFSNAYGFYSLPLPPGNTELVVSFLGNQAFRIPVALSADQELNISLDPAVTLEAIIVTPEEKSNNIFTKSNLHENVLTKQAKLVPGLGGEDDIFRMTHLLPGVQAGTDGLGGLHIRGGNSDQNLILLDGVPVYNADHLAGIFSIFNASAIRSAKLIKGGFPARYGGRISAVFDVRTKDGNRKSWAGNARASLTSFGATLEGPFAKNKGSVLMSFRNSHAGFLLEPALKKTFAGDENATLKYLFRDVNLKLNYRFSQKDQLHFSFYTGTDNFDSAIDLPKDIFTFHNSNERNWGNLITALRWNHLFNNKLFSNTTITGSRYVFNNETLLESEAFEEADKEAEKYFYSGYASEIKDLALKTDFDFLPMNHHHIRFGVGVTGHVIRPEASFANDKTDIDEDDALLNIEQFSDLYEPEKLEALEGFAYLEDEFVFYKKFSINTGIRASGFIQDKAKYGNLEPRINLRFQANKNWSVFAATNRMVQYLHRINASGLSTPNDVWIPASAELKPQTAWQHDLGIDFENANNIRAHLTGYFKKMNGLLSFNDISPFVDFEQNPEDELIAGNGTAYGLECSVEKLSGQTGGWVNYTFAKTIRHFEAQNANIAFPHQYDSRHQFKVYLYHKFSPAFTISANWHYQSALPILLLAEQNFLEEIYPVAVHEPGKKNTIRSASYHRLDVALTYVFTKEKLKHRFKAGVYNVYNRNNVAFHRLDTEADKSKEPVTFLPLLPAFSYELGF